MTFLFPVFLTVLFFEHSRTAYDVIANSTVVVTSTAPPRQQGNQLNQRQQGSNLAAYFRMYCTFKLAFFKKFVSLNAQIVIASRKNFDLKSLKVFVMSQVVTAVCFCDQSQLPLIHVIVDTIGTSSQCPHALARVCNRGSLFQSNFSNLFLPEIQLLPQCYKWGTYKWHFTVYFYFNPMATLGRFPLSQNWLAGPLLDQSVSK